MRKAAIWREDQAPGAGSAAWALRRCKEAPPQPMVAAARPALTAHVATGLGAWAAGAAGFLPKLANVVPSYIECVTIFAHADKAGEEGARKLAAALHQRGIEVVTEGI